MNSFWTATTVLLLGTAQGYAADRLTYVDLVNRLTDLERLAALPEPGEKCAQFSSYDRKSQYDATTGKYLNWTANGDGSGIVREENGQLVLAEMTGPGVIWRTWSAKPEKGHVKIYLDGSATPAVDLPFSGYFDRSHEPFTYTALVHETASGQNNYIPIPYNKSCRIIADKDWGNYYHFTYTTYPKETVLPTFTTSLSADEKAALNKANTFLLNCGTDPADPRSGQEVSKTSHTIKAGDTATVLELAGTRAITAIKVQVDLPGSVTGKEVPRDVVLQIQRDILRDLVLRVSWDGEGSPSVFAPLGDFFGTAPGVNKYKSLPLGMTDDGFYCYWYMPFAKGALVELGNQSTVERKVTFAITHAPVTMPIAALGRFHARWHRDVDAPPEPERQAIDWTILKTEARGRFVGVELHVWNPKGGWWGEGDEKFYIDGEKFPSTFGTGSEDYFGYAWCNPTLFQNGFHNQTISMGNRGHISVNRWHIADNIPFLSSFEGAIEKYYANDRPTFYDCVAYWYQAEPHKPWTMDRQADGNLSKYLELYGFFDNAERYSATMAIEPLREAYRKLTADADLVNHRDKMTLAMSKVEKVAGNKDQYDKLVQPLVEKLTIPFVDKEISGEFREILPTAAAKAGRESVLLVSEVVAESGGDGSAKRILKDGRRCIATACTSGQRYVYFVLGADSKLRKGDRTVRMRITYYYTGDNLPSVQYDSAYTGITDEAKQYHSADAIAKPEAQGWNTAVVSCPRARLGGHQNGESDFRIASPEDKDIYIADVTIEQD